MKDKIILPLGIILMVIAAFMWANEAMSAGTAYLVDERIDGALKQCIYNYLGNEYVITIQAWNVCPTVVEVD